MALTIDQFTRIYRQKISYNKKKRLEAIQQYFINRRDYPINIVNDDADIFLRQIIQFINENPDLDSQVFSDVVDLLYDRYSVGSPFIVYDVNLPTESNFDELLTVLLDFLRETVVYEMFDFTAEQNFEIDRNARVIKIRCRYVEYKRDIAAEGRSDEIAYSGQIPLVFNYARNKVAINTGYQKAANAIVRKINMSCSRTLSLNPVDIESEAARMPNLVGVDRFHSLTLLTINLLLLRLNASNFIIQDILSISFNNDEALRVKNAQLGGNQLLADYDVIHRIYRGDRATHFLVNLTHLSAGGNADLSADVLFDFRNGFKVTFTEANEYANYSTVNAVLDIQDIVRAAVIDPETVNTSEQAILRRIPNITTQDREVYRDILLDLKTTLVNSLPNDVAIIERLFSQRYGL